MATKKDYMPVRSKLIERACSTSIQKLVVNLEEIDEAISIWNDLLERAQPFVSGRLVIRFLKEDKWFVRGETEYEYQPVVGKMVKFVSGRWRFVKLDSVDRYERLSDLRVGKSADSDRLVRKLIDGIELLLNERKAISDLLRVVRRKATGSSVSVSKRTLAMADQALKLKTKIKIDWKENTDAAIQAEQEKNQQRYLAKKQRVQKSLEAKTKK
jgi:hypothetical protein